jgi:hypothetical protein
MSSEFTFINTNEWRSWGRILGGNAILAGVAGAAGYGLLGTTGIAAAIPFALNTIKDGASRLMADQGWIDSRSGFIATEIVATGVIIVVTTVALSIFTTMAPTAIAYAVAEAALPMLVETLWIQLWTEDSLEAATADKEDAEADKAWKAFSLKNPSVHQYGDKFYYHGKQYSSEEAAWGVYSRDHAGIHEYGDSAYYHGDKYTKQDAEKAFSKQNKGVHQLGGHWYCSGKRYPSKEAALRAYSRKQENVVSGDGYYYAIGKEFETFEEAWKAFTEKEEGIFKAGGDWYYHGAKYLTKRDAYKARSKKYSSQVFAFVGKGSRKNTWYFNGKQYQTMNEAFIALSKKETTKVHEVKSDWFEQPDTTTTGTHFRWQPSYWYYKGKQYTTEQNVWMKFSADFDGVRLWNGAWYKQGQVYSSREEAIRA